MKKRILAKLHSRAGESLAETLVATLIAALALVMLAGAIQASAHVITRSKAKIAEYYAANEKVELRSGEVSGTLYVSPANDGSGFVIGKRQSGSSNYPINYYLNDTLGNAAVVSYSVPVANQAAEGGDSNEEG